MKCIKFIFFFVSGTVATKMNEIQLLGRVWYVEVEMKKTKQNELFSVARKLNKIFAVLPDFQMYKKKHMKSRSEPLGSIIFIIQEYNLFHEFI